MSVINAHIAAHLAAVFELRVDLWKACFRAVPVYGPYASVSKPGRRPKGDEWQIAARETPPLAATMPAEFDACNTGILCDGLRVIDIDVDDPVLAAQIVELSKSILGPAPMRSRSNSPRCALPYRAAVGSPPKLVTAGIEGKVEVLGLGQMFVAFGVHWSGEPFTWTPNAPGEMHFDELVSVTEEQIEAFRQEVAILIGAETKEVTSSEPHFRSSLGPTADLNDIEAAINVIPNDGPPDWELWNIIGMALWRATAAGPAGYKMWR